MHAWPQRRTSITPSESTRPSQVSLYNTLFYFERFSVVDDPFIAPPHPTQGQPYCNTIARPLRNIRPPPTDPPFHDLHRTILVMALSLKAMSQVTDYRCLSLCLSFLCVPIDRSIDRSIHGHKGRLASTRPSRVNHRLKRFTYTC